METIKITEEHEKKYLKNFNICPFCDSNDITAGHIEAEDDFAYRNVMCNTCKTEWTEDFQLTGINNAFRD